ncbi:nuclear protein 96-domain-containing protein [Suillus plorans]|uniref:Nuclear protein 96-domain-containing protein n=1 Tax=Suillus plorans TaxID=116603 RepID=A0A9P7ACZ1_9AGAM|nr:nuclear protein 96-domain-containing protein [Suillus plorans]KAG1786824.1 nuclear protein 96-domain-containing protein [Suillus plorans]
MTRFSAAVSDSSDDEHDVHMVQDFKKSPVRSPPKLLENHNTKAGSDEDIGVDQESDEETSEEDSSSDMQEDDLAPARSRPTRNHVLTADSDDETEDGSESTSSRSASSSESDVDVSAQREDASVIPWARQVGVDAQKMHVMQTSLFRIPEEAVAIKAMNRATRPQFKLPLTVRRKHSRDSIGDGLRMDSQERASFAHDIEPPAYRPSRKYARVEISASAVAGCEDGLVDAGLAFGRSFRVGWGPGGTLVHLGRLSAPSSQIDTSANSSVITKTIIPLFARSHKEANIRLSRLLQHHLSKTPIVKDESGIPFADPTAELDFSSFVSLYPSSDHSDEQSLFRLGRALFDSIDLHLAPEMTVDVRNRISAVRRKAALSDWLEEAIGYLVDADLKKHSSGDSAACIYTLLTGNQVEKACEAAMDNGYIKLATLISQASGDFEFREDLMEQIQLWREQRIDVHIGESTRKIYALLAGILDVVEGSKASSLEHCPDVDPIKGLDWKRTFGLHMWFSEPMDAPISQVFESYNRSRQESPSRVAPPLPSYLEHSSEPLPFNVPTPSPSDALFSLIRLHADPACSLSQALSPLSFGPSPGDYSLSWHLYIILSRCMRIRDFADRADPGNRKDAMDDDNEQDQHEGHSPSADLLASSYAHQLEQLGMLQEAVFVLLHIEGSAGREKAIKDLLHRSADKLDEWMCSGILGSLKIPVAWVNEARAVYAIYEGKVFEAYQLYLNAGLYQQAHDLAVVELAPEAVIRQDLDLLVSLFERIANQTVDGWHTRGKVYMDYAHAMTRIPELHASLTESAVPDTVEEQELDNFTRTVPRLINVLPDVLSNPSDPRHKVALAEMISGLTAVLDIVRPLALSQSQIKLTAIDEATKLRHIQTTFYEKYMRSIQAS